MTRKEAIAILRPQGSTEADLKSAYRSACLLHHPDKGGDSEIMKLVNLAYELLKKITFCEQDIESARSETPLTEKIRPIWDRIKTMPDIEGEIIGSWLWVRGNTYHYRDTFKEMGLKWSKSKKAWYWHSPDEKFWKKSKTEQSWDSIRNYFGSFDLDSEPAGSLS
jgi:hypothetical protein